jgi:hypothetical protein
VHLEEEVEKIKLVLLDHHKLVVMVEVVEHLL